MAEDKELERLRDQIDQIDSEIQDLINRRVSCAVEIANVKKKVEAKSETKDFYRPEREAQILRAVISRNTGPMPSEEMARIFREIMSASLAAEAPLTVAVLGPAGTYTQAAAFKHFGHSIKTLDVPGVDDVFKSVETGQAHYGVAPLENSTEGAVTNTLDLLVDTPLLICGEIYLKVNHQLISKATDISQIEKVYSHSQSVAQCRKWLSQNLGNAEIEIASSNAEAAKRVSDEPKSAAIAGSAAAEIYELNILASDIEDNPANTTRFVVIGTSETNPSGKDKSSLLVSSKNRPGALFHLLEPLAKNNVSMTRIESRPSRNTLWEYVFFVDIEGHVKEEVVSKVLGNLQNDAAAVKILGSYPQAVL